MAYLSKNIAVLILAAGASSRMGRAKQLLPWKETTLLGTVVKSAKSYAPKDIVVVLGANAERIGPGIQGKGVEVIENKNWRYGLGESLAFGTAHLLEKKATYDGVLVMLGDQPFVDEAFLRTMTETFYSAEKGIAAASYGNRVGVPALFSKRYFELLADVKGDSGAKTLLQEHRKDVIPVTAQNITLDIDTQQDYEELKNL